jgi:hypothetical protein
LLALQVSWRNDEGLLASLHRIGVVDGQPFVLLSVLEFVNPAHRVESVESGLRPALGQRLDRFLITAALPADIADFDGNQPGLFLQQMKGSATGNAAMLTRVTLEHNSGVIFRGYGEELGHVAGAHQARLIDPQQTARQLFLHLAIGYQPLKRVGGLESFILAENLSSRLRRGCHDDDQFPGRFDGFDRFPHLRRLAGPSDTADDHDAVAGFKHVTHGRLLAGVEPVPLQPMIRRQRTALTPPLTGIGQHRPLFLQYVAGGHHRPPLALPPQDAVAGKLLMDRIHGHVAQAKPKGRREQPLLRNDRLPLKGGLDCLPHRFVGRQFFRQRRKIRFAHRGPPMDSVELFSFRVSQLTVPHCLELIPGQILLLLLPRGRPEGRLGFGGLDAQGGGLSFDEIGPPRELLEERWRQARHVPIFALAFDAVAQVFELGRQAGMDRRLPIRGISFQVTELAGLPSLLNRIEGGVEGEQVGMQHGVADAVHGPSRKMYEFRVQHVARRTVRPQSDSER